MRIKYVIDQLEKNSKTFEALLSDLTPEQKTWKPSIDKWCLLEIVNHLYDEERKDFKARLGKILNKDSEWDPIDPVGWVKSEKYMEKDFDQTLNSFLEERKRSIDWLTSLNVDWNTKASHPKFGEFPSHVMLYNWLAHDYLHMRQIIRLKYEMIKADLQPGELSYAGEW